MPLGQPLGHTHMPPGQPLGHTYIPMWQPMYTVHGQSHGQHRHTIHGSFINLLTWRCTRDITNSAQIGGGKGKKSVTWTYAEIKKYAVSECYTFEDNQKFDFMSNVYKDILIDKDHVKTQIPIQLLDRLSRTSLLQICNAHNIQATQRSSLSELLQYISEHAACDVCLHGYVVFTPCKQAKTGAELIKAYRDRKKTVLSNNENIIHLSHPHRTSWKQSSIPSVMGCNLEIF
jgi:hypothetical protein